MSSFLARIEKPAFGNLARIEVYYIVKISSSNWEADAEVCLEAATTALQHQQQHHQQQEQQQLEGNWTLDRCLRHFSCCRRELRRPADRPDLPAVPPSPFQKVDFEGA